MNTKRISETNNLVTG